jgi:hypothetical protein
LGKKLQTFSLRQGIELPQDEEFDIWLEQLYGDAAISQEFVATCRTLGLQPSEKGKLREWLQDLVVRSRGVFIGESSLVVTQGAAKFNTFLSIALSGKCSRIFDFAVVVWNLSVGWKDNIHFAVG